MGRAPNGETPLLDKTGCVSYFNFYGVSMAIYFFDQRFSPVQDLVLFYFKHFSSNTDLQAKHVEIELKPPQKPIGKKSLLFKTNFSDAYSSPEGRLCILDAQNWLTIKDSADTTRITIYSDSSTTAFEMIRYTALSIIGEKLEEKGYLRLHAAGITKAGTTFIFLMPSGAGKSTKALRHLQGNNGSLFGDEILLTKDGQIFAFPMPISMKYIPTWSHSFDVEINTQAGKRYLWQINKEDIAPPLFIDKLYLLSSMPSQLLVLHFFISVFLGLGLPQMREFFFRKKNLIRIFLISHKRLILVFKLMLKIKIMKVQSNHASA